MTRWATRLSCSKSSLPAKRYHLPALPTLKSLRSDGGALRISDLLGSIRAGGLEREINGALAVLDGELAFLGAVLFVPGADCVIAIGQALGKLELALGTGDGEER